MHRKVCHLTSVHSIDDGRIFRKECTSLAANGFDVTLIACGNESFEEIKNGVKRISLKVPVKNRLQRLLIRSRIVYKKALEVDTDIYHFHDPELIPVGLKLKKKGKKVIYDSHEDTAELIKTRKWIPKIFRSTIHFLFDYYEQNSIKKFDAIISVTPLLVNKFKKWNKNSLQITNYPIYKSALLEHSLLNKRKDLVFAGGITHAYMFENILKSLVKTKNVRLKLAGRPVTSDYLEYLKSFEGWKKIDYYGLIPHIDVLELYNNSLVGIACLGYIANVGYKEGSLGVQKLFEFMGCGLAVICTDFKLWKEIIEKEKCGICINPYNVDEITNAIQYLIDNPEIAIEMGRNGQKAVEREYNWKTQEDKLINIYNNLGDS